MKKNLLFPLAVVMLLSCSSASVQAQNIQFKLDLSPRISWLQSNVTEGVTTKGSVLGYQAGLGVYLFFAPHYAFSTGIHLLQAGGKLAYPDTVLIRLKDRVVTLPGQEILTHRLQYASVPLGFHFETVEIGYLRFFTNVGVNFLYRVSATTSSANYTIEKGYINQETKGVNITYHGTAGLSYSLGESTAIQGGLTYTHGLLDITMDEGGKPVDRMIFHSLGLQVSIIF